MIKYWVSLLLSVGYTQAFSQTDQGSFYINGSATINFNNVEREVDAINTDLGTQTTLLFTPSLAYFIKDNFAIGGNIGWSRQAFKDTDDNLSATHTFTLGPLVRYYTEVGPFFQTQLGIGGGVSKRTLSTSQEFKTDISILSWGVGVGYAYFFSDRVSVEPLMLFFSERRTFKETGPDSTDILRGLNLQIGFAYYIL